jgi:hypothetical protein
MNGPGFPICKVLSFAKTDDTVSIRVRTGWLFWRREQVWRFSHSKDGMAWYWADTGVPLESAPAYVWKGLYHAAGLDVALW